MYATKYILAFTNDLNELYEIYFDYLDFIGTPQNVIGAVDALVLRSTNGDENKLEPILGTECLLNIVVGKTSDHNQTTDDSTLTIYDLIAQHDNDIRITIYQDRDYTKSVYQGFVVVEDNSQPFLDPPFTLSIRALDGLGLLKQVDMVDANEELFSGNISIQDWLGNILYKTGLSLNLRTYFPFYPIGSSSTQPSLEQVFLNARTWQTGELTTTTDPSVDVFASEAKDAYTALQTICKCFRARLFQQDGVWNFVSLYEYIDPNGFAYNESTGTLTDGVYTMTTTSVGSGLNYDITIGNDATLLPVKDDQVLYLKLASKWVKLNYTYDQSVNKICNQGLNQGQANASYDEVISSTVIDATISPVVSLPTFGEDLFCWDHFDGTTTFGSLYPPNAATGRAFVRKVHDLLGYEILRFGVIDASGTPPLFSWVRSSRILIDTNDIFQMNMSFRWRDNFVQTHAIGVAAVYLYGDDGSHWVLRCVDDNSVFVSTGNVLFKTEWVSADSNFRVVGGSTIYIQTQDMTGIDLNTWNSITVNNTQPAHTPVSGEIEINIVNQYPSDGLEMWFKDLRVTILPYLNGSYTEVKGDYNFSSSLDNIKQTVSEDVEISDSPKRYFKGALIQSNGELWPGNWHRLGILESWRFTQLMERIYWNNVNRIMQKIEGTFRGLTYTTSTFEVNQAGYINRYSFSDHPIPTKKFILTSFEKDYGTGHGRCVFVEIMENESDTAFENPADPAIGDYKFQYLFQ